MFTDLTEVNESKTSVATLLGDWEEVAIGRLKPAYSRVAIELARVRNQVNVTKILGSLVSIACTCITVMELCTEQVQLDFSDSLLIAATGFAAGAMAGGASILEYSAERRQLSALSADEQTFRHINTQLDSTADSLLARLSSGSADEPIKRTTYQPVSLQKSDVLQAIGAPTGRIALAALNCSDDVLRAAAFVLPARSAILFVLLAFIDIWTVLQCIQQIKQGGQVSLARNLLDRCSLFEVKSCAVHALLDAADHALAGNHSYLHSAVRRYRSDSTLRLASLVDTSDCEKTAVTAS